MEGFCRQRKGQFPHDHPFGQWGGSPSDHPTSAVLHWLRRSEALLRKIEMRQVEPDPAEMAARYGAETTVLDWREPARLFSLWQSEVDMVVTRTKRGG